MSVYRNNWKIQTPFCELKLQIDLAGTCFEMCMDNNVLICNRNNIGINCIISSKSVTLVCCIIFNYKFKLYNLFYLILCIIVQNKQMFRMINHNILSAYISQTCFEKKSKILLLYQNDKKMCFPL